MRSVERLVRTRKDGGAAVGAAVPVRAVLGATETDMEAMVTDEGVSALSMLRKPLMVVSPVHDEIVVDTHAAFHSVSTAMSKLTSTPAARSWRRRRRATAVA